MSPAQQKAIDLLESGGRLVSSYTGYHPCKQRGFRPSRALHPKTESVVIEYFGDRLRNVYVRSPKYNIGERFLCLVEHVEANADDRKIIYCTELS